MSTNNANDPLSDPANFMMFVHGLSGAGRKNAVPGFLQAALDRHPADPAWRAAIAKIAGNMVPPFHRGMLEDRRRNRLYAQAIERFAKGRKVLDIGTGSGLLAMMAVRAGAEKVYACEANPLLAATAKQVIAANGMSDRIILYAQESKTLSADEHLDGGVDVVVSELFSDTLLSEAALPTLEHARQELCLPGAIFVPERAAIRIALANFTALEGAFEATQEGWEVEGLDMSSCLPFLGHSITCDPCHPALTLSSAAHTAFRFDFSMMQAIPATERVTIPIKLESDSCNAIAQWLEIRFAEDLVYENAPGSDKRAHWLISLSPAGPFKGQAGETVEVQAHRDQLDIALSAKATSTD